MAPTRFFRTRLGTVVNGTYCFFGMPRTDVPGLAEYYKKRDRLAHPRAP